MTRNIILPIALFILIPINSLTAGTKEDYDKVTKNLIEAQSLNSIAAKAWRDYKGKTKFPSMSAEERQKMSAANKKLKEGKKNHPDLLKINKEADAAKKKYYAAKKATKDSKVKKAPQDKQDALKSKEDQAKKVMFATMHKQSDKAKGLVEIQKLKNEETIVAEQARATQYAADPQAKSLYSRSLATSKECARLLKELNEIKAQMKK